ncbi:MAG TPA: aminoacyl-tRNA hydrolase [Bacteroidales bacterium]|nr:aminoacyl-tRNA hydrolase [Bacteroidales bacterium]
MDKYLIVGLGNVGEEYIDTKHNIGFTIIDALALKFQLNFSLHRYGFLANFNYKGKKIILIKPSTYMNLSGKAVKYWINKENIYINNLLVIADDIALPLGVIRLRKKGSDGGHNGLSNIIYELNTNEFSRLRFGIGNNFPRGYQVKYVLSKWEEEEKKIIIPRIEIAIDAILSFITVGIDNTMNMYNNK